jgi:hypothetical protein
LNGKQEGEGEYYKADGVMKKGLWTNGKKLRWL